MLAEKALVRRIVYIVLVAEIRWDKWGSASPWAIPSSWLSRIWQYGFYYTYPVPIPGTVEVS